MAQGDSFNELVESHQVAWRQNHVTDARWGTQNGVSRPWILPAEMWEQGLWSGIRSESPYSLANYLAESDIQKHVGAHNLKSSWMLCANLYFPFSCDEGRPLLAGFLKQHISSAIETVEAVELEYEEAAPLDPGTLLGEPAGGPRGVQQTSPDVAFLVRTAGGKGLVLTENKLAEHSFYPCSGRKSDAGNPDAGRCLAWQTLVGDLPKQCWQLGWERGTRKNRKYWNHIRLSEHGRQALTRCPAATGGYQLFRQQALAEGIAASGRYDFVASCVAYDPRNMTLTGCLRDTGIDHFATGWAPLFDGLATFSTFTHQQWVSWVRENDRSGQWNDWLSYIASRYGYPGNAA